MHAREEIAISVIFTSTATRLIGTHVGGLYCDIVNDEPLSMGFDGPTGLRNWISGPGYKKQCEQAKVKILEHIRNGKKVKLNCFGYSRGGVAATYLVKMLGGYNKDILETNLALLDPVPGNTFIAQILDFFHLTWARQVMDLSDCHNLQAVHAIYSGKKLHPFINPFFAPVLPKYPSKTRVNEVIVDDKDHFSINTSDIVSKMKSFLQTCRKSITESKLLDIKAFKKQVHSQRKTTANKIKNNEPSDAPIQPESTAHLLNEFVNDLQSGMSLKSKRTEKMKCFEKIKAEMKTMNDETVKQSLPRILQNTLALALQRDRNRFSFYSTTQTGYCAKKLLESEKYSFLANQIQGSAANDRLRYRDLRMFVAGKNNTGLFSAKNRNNMYELIKKSPITDIHLTYYCK